MKKVATYCRVSLRNNSELALAKQQEQLKAYCESKGYIVAHTDKVVGDRKLGNEMFLRCLLDAKDKGVDTIVMASTNRIVGTADEMLKVAEAYEAAGVTIETLDGSHLFPKANELILASLCTSDDDADFSGIEDDTELVFGYDVTEAGLVVNEAEAEVVRYIFDKNDEYSSNPPAELVQEVIDEHKSRGDEITADEAAKRVSHQRITSLIEDEVKEKWPEQFESMVSKRAHNRSLHERRNSHLEPIIDHETWQKVQERMSDNMGGNGPEMGGLSMT